MADIICHLRPGSLLGDVQGLKVPEIITANRAQTSFVAEFSWPAWSPTHLCLLLSPLLPWLPLFLPSFSLLLLHSSCLSLFLPVTENHSGRCDYFQVSRMSQAAACLCSERGRTHLGFEIWSHVAQTDKLFAV